MTWTARITPDGTRRLEKETKRVEAERERARKEEQAKAERERKQQQLRGREAELLRDVIAAGGRLDLGADSGPAGPAADAEQPGPVGLLPDGQSLAQEPTRRDAVLGVTVYLEPDFEALTAACSFNVPRQLRSPHPAVAAFQSKKALVSKGEIGRAARFLQALVLAAPEVGWKSPARIPNMSRERGDSGPDRTLQLPSHDELAPPHERLEYLRSLPAIARRHAQGTRTRQS